MFGDQVVENVKLVPNFLFKLLYVSKLTRELSCFVSFYPYFYVFQDILSGRVMGFVRKMEDRTYSELELNLSSWKVQDIPQKEHYLEI